MPRLLNEGQCKDVAFGYDIIGGNKESHAKMVDVMQDDIKATKKLNTFWVKRTTRTPEKFAEFVVSKAKQKGVRFKRLNVWVSAYDSDSTKWLYF